MISAAQFLRRDPALMRLLPDGDKVKVESANLEATGFSFQKATHTRQFWILGAVYFLFNFCAQTVMVHIYPHAVDLGISGAVAATILTTIGGGSIAGRFIMGSAGDRIGNKLAMIITLTTLVVAFLWLQLAREIWMLYLFAVIYGFAHGGLYALISPMVAELFGLGSHGVIFGTIIFGGAIGGAIGPIMVGYIFDITNSYQLGFFLLAIASIIAAILSVVLSKPKDTGHILVD